MVLNHLWPTRLTGGYVGVDVFFVISGFLITSHLTREIMTTGRIALASFYARRVRRLLPAALLVLVVSAIGTLLLLPYPRWPRAGAEIIASAGYVENWFLGAMSVNYSAVNDQATVAQHYWSLSVEEQFYLLWPLLLLVASWWAAKRAARPQVIAAAVLTTLVIVSLASSVIATTLIPNPAYFATYTRAWEFGIGGLLALLATRRLPVAGANLLALSGLASIAAAAVLFGPETPFPGVAALLPVLGTSAVILAGTGRERLWHSAVTGIRPVQWIGDVSYSLYLWHWPLIVLVPFLIGAAPSTGMKIGILALSVVLAWLTARFVERPGQRWKVLTVSPRRTLLAMVAGIAAVAAVGGGLVWAGRAVSAADIPPESVTIQECVGPQAMDPGADCPDRFGPAADVVMGPGNAYFAVPEECRADPALLPFGETTATVVCDFSGGDPDASTVWLVGDSHAQQWQGAVFDLARAKGWIVTTSFGGGCPVIDAPFVGFREPASAAEQERCTAWSAAVQAAVIQTQPDVVLTSSAGRVQLIDDGTDRPQTEQFVDGLQRTWRAWTDVGVTVVALGGVPFNGEERSPDCLLINARNPLACAVPVAEAQPADPYLLAARASGPAMLSFDAGPHFCDEKHCYAAIGGTAVYYDADHLNLDYVRRFAPMLSEVVGTPARD